MNERPLPESPTSKAPMSAFLSIAVTAEARRLVSVAIDQLRGRGIALDQRQTAELQSRVESEIIKLWTAQKAQVIIGEQVKDSLSAIQRIIERVAARALEPSNYAR